MESKTDYLTDDSQLVYYIREGNDDAKDELYKKYSPLIHKEINRAKKKALVYGVEFADLSQEVMLAFSHAIYNYSDEADVKFITFATTCIRRRLANFLDKLETEKNKSMLNSVALDAVMSNQKSLIDQVEEIVSSEPLRKLINHETLGEISKQIDENLSDKEKMALSYNLSGKSVDEIAEIMGMNSKQIYNLVYRARSKIKLPH